jgi:hypothetical protein
MKIGQFEGGLISHTDLKHTCAKISELHTWGEDRPEIGL